MRYRTAFITGASSGIGRALALEIARHGVEVGLAARRGEDLEALAEEIRGAGGAARVYPLDVTDAEAVQAVVGKADDELGGIDLMIANAGVARPRWSGKLEWEHCEPTIMINVAGTVATLTAIIPRMVSRKRGHLVAISSLAGYRGLPRFAVYCGSKAFLHKFMESLRVDLRATGVKVTDVRPGFVRTALNEGNNDKLPFLVEVEDAARIIWQGIAKEQPVVQFPKPLVAMLHSMVHWPPAVYDRASKLLKF
jgi:short-subunit dehydrogenase